ncbi:MAG: cell wall surface anchor family protein [Marmoricola sp.]|nr:cell wall surface anchor family protein [Marmoricola sp.]
MGATGPAGAKGDTGAPGTNGTNGAAGAKGDTGDTGAAGSQWLTGITIPANTLGVDGDWYLDTLTSNAFQKVAGTWTLRVNLQGVQGDKGDRGDVGAAGANGTDGAKGDKGDAGDAGAAGANGTNGTDGAKGDTGAVGANGAKGDNGAAGTNGLNGATWLMGAGVPLGTLGADNDLYLNTGNGDVYRKSAGSWSMLTNIKGPKGDTGAAGANGTNGADGGNGSAGANGTTWYTGSTAPAAATGADGDFYLNTATGDLYRKASGAWGSPIVDLISSGSGTSGTSWYTGSGAPTGISSPATGSLYLNTGNGDIYKYSGSAWALIWSGSTYATPSGVSYKREWASTSTIDANGIYLAGGSVAQSNIVDPYGVAKTLFSYTRGTNQPDVNDLEWAVTLGQGPQGGVTVDGIPGFVTTAGAYVRCAAYRNGTRISPFQQFSDPIYSSNLYNVANRYNSFEFSALVPGGVAVGQTLSVQCQLMAATNVAVAARQVLDVQVDGMPVTYTTPNVPS